MNNLIFKQLNNNFDDYETLLSLMLPYNRELDKHNNRTTTESVIISVTKSMLQLQAKPDRWLEACFLGNNPIGFYQCKIDHSDDRGYKKIGYGYIMEFYIKSKYRLKGYGKAMLERIETHFSEKGVSNIYLTADSVTGEPFWSKMEFTFNGEISHENNLKIYEKELKVNCLDDYVYQEIDNIKFKIKEQFNFEFIHKYGTVFKVFDDQDSGNICFGIRNNKSKYFVKFAGAKTAEYNGKPADAVERLKATLPIYQNLKHKNLIELIKAEEIGNGFAMIFKWADGECMGRMYPESHKKIMALPVETKLNIFNDIINFFEYIVSKNYLAVDFYDGSIMYDERTGKTTICDIDFFRASPSVNDMGKMWGSDRFLAPEEYELGATLDEVTNVFTLGATAFSLFTDSDFSREHWVLNDEIYSVLTKAMSKNRNERYQSIKEFKSAWYNATRS